MKLLFFSKKKKLPSCFGQLINGKETQVSVLPASDFKVQFLKQADLIYLDAEDFAESVLEGIIKKNAQIYFLGLYDEKGKVNDPALFFALGLADYLGPSLAKSLVSLKRLQTILKLICLLRKNFSAPSLEAKAETSNIPYASSWDVVKTGKEYIFAMMAVELDGIKDLNARYDSSHLKGIIEYFQNSLARIIAPVQGKIWIWKEFGGIILFPLEENIQEIVACGMRLMLSRRLLSLDYSKLKLLLSYRLALIPGSTIYQERGKTGRIISDSINLLSHICQHFAKPGNFYLADSFYQKLSEAQASCFSKAAAFESQNLYRLCLPANY